MRDPPPRADGTFKLEVNRATRDQLAADETRTQKITYTVINGGSDRVSGELNVVLDGYSHTEGSNSANTLNGTASNDHLVGQGNSEALSRGLGVSGAGGHDILVGGQVEDRLTGRDGSDVFQWHLGNAGAKCQPAIGLITDINAAPASNNGNVLDLRDLRDLLQGENQGKLFQYLYFDTASTPGSTHIRVSTTGGFTETSSASGAEDQRITLANVDIRAPLGLDAQASDHQLIAELMQRGKLLVELTGIAPKNTARWRCFLSVNLGEGIGPGDAAVVLRGLR